MDDGDIKFGSRVWKISHGAPLSRERFRSQNIVRNSNLNIMSPIWFSNGNRITYQFDVSKASESDNKKIAQVTLDLPTCMIVNLEYFAAGDNQF